MSAVNGASSKLSARKSCGGVTVFFVTAFAASAALAQQAPQSLDSQTLEEIVVTAQKRQENLQDVPISITAVTATELQNQHIYDPTQLPFVAPTLQMESFNAAVGAQVFAIRGVGTLSFASSIESSAALVVDDVTMGRPEFAIMNLSDVQQVEVLNGPQGMLFGKNASAGLVNITTVKPVLGSYQVIGHGEYGAMTTPGDGHATLGQATLNMPIGDTAALRLNGFYTKHDPLVADVFPSPGSNFGQTQEGGRVKFLWQPTDKLDVLIAGDYAASAGEGPGATADRSISPGSPFGPLDAAVGITPGPDNAKLSSDGATDNHFHVGGGQVNVNYDVGGGYTITNIAAVREYRNSQIFDVDDHQINIFNLNNSAQNYQQITEELRLTSPKGERFDFQGGLYYYNARLQAQSVLHGNLGGPPPPPPFAAILGISSSSVEHSESYAAYGQGTLHFNDRARLIVGARETYDALNLRSFSTQDGNLFSLGLPGDNFGNQSLYHANLSGRVIVQFDFTKDVMAYASWARGYKGPGFNIAFNTNAPTVKPEYPTDYEIGVKTNFFDHRMTLDISAYTETFKDFQDQSYDVATTSYLITNAGELQSRGFEASLAVLPMENLNLSAGISYVDAYFSKFDLDQCYAGQPNCSGNGTTNSSGNRLPNAPRWTGTLQLDYHHHIGKGLDVSFTAAEYARTWVNFSANADPHTVQAGYALLNSTVGLGSSDGRWRVSAFCRNCLDKRFVAYIEANPVSPTDYGQQFSLNSFRTVGGAVDFRY